MTKLSPKGLKWLKFFHVMAAVCWIGCSIGMNVLKHTVQPENPDQMYILSLAIKILDEVLIYVGTLGCLVTGIIYGACTKWGFFKYRWINVKWVLTFAMILFGTIFTGPAVTGNVQAIDWYAGNLGIYESNLSTTSLWGGIQLLILVTVFYLSVFKPWMGKKEGRK